MRRRCAVILFSLSAVAAGTAATAAACPVCDSATGRDVRAGLADDDWPTTAAAILLPFAVVGGVVGLIHFGGRGRP